MSPSLKSAQPGRAPAAKARHRAAWRRRTLPGAWGAARPQHAGEHPGGQSPDAEHQPSRVSVEPSPSSMDCSALPGVRWLHGGHAVAPSPLASTLCFTSVCTARRAMSTPHSSRTGRPRCPSRKPAGSVARARRDPAPAWAVSGADAPRATGRRTASRFWKKNSTPMGCRTGSPARSDSHFHCGSESKAMRV